MIFGKSSLSLQKCFSEVRVYKVGRMIVSPGTCFARSLTRSAKFNLYIIQRNKYNYTKQTDEEREIADSGRFKFFGSAIIERLPSLKPPVGQWYEDWFNTHVETFEKYNRNWTFEELAAGMADPSKAVANSSTQAKKKAKKKDAGPTTMNEDKLRKIYGLPKEDDEEQASQEPVAEKPLEFYPRETVFDKNDDRRALYRCLDRSIYLLVRKKRKEDPWQFPLAVWNENETMREVGTFFLYFCCLFFSHFVFRQ